MGRGRPSWWEQVEAREEGKQDQKKKMESKAEQQMESQGRRRLLLRALVSTGPLCGKGLPESRGRAASPPPAWGRVGPSSAHPVWRNLGCVFSHRRLLFLFSLLCWEPLPPK